MVSLFTPHAAKRGPSFNKYACETKVVQQAKLVRGKSGVDGEALLVKDMRRVLGPSMSINKLAMKAALEKIFTEQKFKMTDSEKEDWRETITRRTRNLARVVQLGLQRKSEWVTKVLDDKATSKTTAAKKNEGARSR